MQAGMEGDRDRREVSKDISAPNQSIQPAQDQFDLSKETPFADAKSAESPDADLAQPLTDARTAPVWPQNKEAQSKRDWSPIKLLDPREYFGAIKEIAEIFQTGKRAIGLVWQDAKRQILASASLSLAGSLAPTFQGGAFALTVAAVQSSNPTLGALALAAVVGASLLQTLVGRKSATTNTQLNNTCMLAIEKRLLSSVTAMPGEITDKQEMQGKITLAKDQGGEIPNFIGTSITTASTAVALVTSAVAVGAVSPLAGAITALAGLPMLIVAKEQQRIWREFQDEVKEPGRQFWTRRYGLLTPRRLKEVQMLGAEGKIVDDTVEALEQCNEIHLTTIKKDLRRHLWPAVAQIGATGSALGYCLSQATAGELSLPAFSFLSGAIYTLSSTISSFAGSIGSQIGSGQKLLPQFDVFEEGARQRELESNRKKTIDWSRPPKIEFKGVSLSYEGKDELALDDVSFTIEPGQKVLIIGENGAGKSSLMKLLAGIYTPTSGDILINSINLKDISRKNWHQGFAIMPQDVTLQDSFTVRYNLTLGLSPAPETATAIEEIVKKYQLEKLIGGRDPLNRIVGEGYNSAFEPSGGQRRLLGLARTEIKRPKLVVYDEPTANLDGDIAQQVEYEVFAAAREQDRTMILVTHDYLSGIDCDLVIEMGLGGKIKAMGTSQDLLARPDTLIGRQAREAQLLAARIEQLSRQQSREQ